MVNFLPFLTQFLLFVVDCKLFKVSGDHNCSPNSSLASRLNFFLTVVPLYYSLYEH